MPSKFKIWVWLHNVSSSYLNHSWTWERATSKVSGSLHLSWWHVWCLKQPSCQDERLKALQVKCHITIYKWYIEMNFCYTQFWSYVRNEGCLDQMILEILFLFCLDFTFMSNELRIFYKFKKHFQCPLTWHGENSGNSFYLHLLSYS